ncbi:MAG TPA: ABC transporter permease [Usitatibacter sp.]|jgi:putative spermidine/putrescine transport system permease protein
MASIPVGRRGRALLAAWPLWPQALVLVAFFVIPAGFIANASLHDKAGGWTFAHYLAFAVDPYNRGVVLRTIGIGVSTTLLTLVLGYPLARAISRGSTFTRWFLSAAVFFPLLTSSVIRSFGWLVLLGSNGLLNDTLQFLGLPKVQLIFNSVGVTIALAQVLLPFMVLSLVSGLANIDPAIEDAAATLGSTPARRFFKVTVPMLAPGILAGSLLVFAIAISSFVTPALIGGPRAEVMATMIYTNATQVANIGGASAASLILLAVTLFVVTLYYRVIFAAAPDAAGRTP